MTAQAQTSPNDAAPPPVPGAIDTDVHHTPSAVDELFPYLSDQWRDYIVERGLPGFEPNYYPPGAPISARPDLASLDGRPVNAASEALITEVLDRACADHAVLNCLYGRAPMQNSGRTGGKAYRGRLASRCGKPDAGAIHGRNVQSLGRARLHRRRAMRPRRGTDAR